MARQLGGGPAAICLALFLCAAVLVAAPSPAAALFHFERTDYATGGGAVDLACADIDRDGAKDLAVADHDAGVVSVLWGVGDGTFTAGPELTPFDAGPAAVCVGRFLAGQVTGVAVLGPGYASVFPYAGARTFGSRVDSDFLRGGQGDWFFEPVDAETVPVPTVSDDYQDGIVVATDSIVDSMRTLVSQGDGTFTESTPTAVGINPVALRVTTDHTTIVSLSGPAVVVASRGSDFSSGSVSLYRYFWEPVPGATRAPYAAPRLGAEGRYWGSGQTDTQGVYAADLDFGTGAADLVDTLTQDGLVRVWRGGEEVPDTRDGAIFAWTLLNPATYGAGPRPGSVDGGDLDRDFNKELVVANDAAGAADYLTILTPTYTGPYRLPTYQTAAQVPVGSAPEDLIVTDVSGDGRPDIVALDRGSGVTVLVGSPGPIGSLQVDGDALCTGSRTVSIESAFTLATRLRIRDGVGGSWSPWSDWREYAAVTTWELSSQDGTHTVQVEYADVDGGSRTYGDAILLDTTPPVTTDDAPAGWLTVSPWLVSLQPEDGGSGIFGGPAGTRHSVDGAPWTGGTLVMVGGDGQHTVSYRSTDAAGNQEATRTCSVRIDTEAPLTTVSGAPGGWSRLPVRLEAGASDATSGVALTEYSLDGGRSWAGETSVTVSAEGTTTVLFRSVDVAGNVETAGSTQVLVDTTPPETADDIADGWATTDPVSVTLTVTEGGSGMGGIAHTEYKLDDEDWTRGSTVVVAGEGVHELRYRSADAAGNQEEEHVREVRIDTSAPVTTVSGVPPDWSRTPVTLEATATDPISGVASTSFSTDGGRSWTAATSVTIAAEGTTTVLWRSEDVAGNVEAAHSVQVRIDSIAPETVDDIPDGWVRAPSLLVTLTARDGGSGMDGRAWTEYRLDGALAWTRGASLLVKGEGVHTLRYRSVDDAGNREAERVSSVRIDSVPPASSVGGASDAWLTPPVRLRFSAADASSGVAFLESSLDGGPWVQGAERVVTAAGRHVVESRAADLAGNVEVPARSVAVKIDGGPPVVGADLPSVWTNGDVTVGLRAEDAESGMARGRARIMWSLDGGTRWQTALSVSTVAVRVPADAALHTTDGLLLLYRAADATGNISPVRSCVVPIDTRSPRTTTRPTTAAPGGAAVFTYTVTDPTPGSPLTSAAVPTTIRIVDGRGRAVTTLTVPDAVPTNAVSTYVWPRCSLPRGVYSFLIAAVDQAGNRSQAAAGSLVVR